MNNTMQIEGPREEEMKDHQDEILPRSKNVQLTSDVVGRQSTRRIKRQSSNLFARLMSSNTFQSLSTRNLLLHNDVFRNRVCSITMNVFIRLLTLFMNVLLLLLSVAYCIAELSDVHLVLFKECTPKTKEEIYHHSYLAGLQADGTVEITPESHWGLTTDACWTTKRFNTDTDRLWNSNVYEHEWSINIGMKVVLFALLTAYSVWILMYNIKTIDTDIYHLRRNTLHTMSSRRTASMNDEMEDAGCFSRLKRTIFGLLESEGTTWVIRCVMFEIFEFIIVTSTLYLHNGYSWTDRNNQEDVYLARKPYYVKQFASVIAFNMFGSAVLWLSYAFAPGKCHGLTFRMMMFFIDDLSDLFYTLFPLLVIYMDEYNTNSDDVMILLGHLDLDHRNAFVSAFFFLFALSTKSFHLVYSSCKELRDRYYVEFELMEADVSWIDVSGNTKKLKQALLCAVSCGYIAGGVLVLLRVFNHMADAETYCNSIKESNFMIDDKFMRNAELTEIQKLALELNPELFVWDHCLYKTYPFTESRQHRCQCRVLVSDWSDLKSSMEDRAELQITQNYIFESWLENSIMLEKLKVTGEEENPEISFRFNASMFQSIHMKAFEWPHHDHSNTFEAFDEHVAAFSKLEYLGMVRIPSTEFQMEELRHLSKLQHLALSFVLIQENHLIANLDFLCNLDNLQILHFWLRDNLLLELPKCLENSKQLTWLNVEGLGATIHLPLSIFGLSTLEYTSFWSSGLSWNDILHSNLPDEVNKEDKNELNKWFENHFHFNEHAEYHMQFTPLCDLAMVDYERFPKKFETFLRKACGKACEKVDSSFNDLLCEPYMLGDGKCDFYCNTASCRFDDGDCLQLCFAKELTECSWDKLTNNVCDVECNNKYCVAYRWTTKGDDVAIGEPQLKIQNDGQYGADLLQCPQSRATTNDACNSSTLLSEHLDPLIPKDVQTQCQSEWIGDSICDDACFTADCSFDGGDCQQGCTDACNLLTQSWSFIILGGGPTIDQEIFCSERLPAFVELLLGSSEAIVERCTQLFQVANLNNDTSLNFREFQILVTLLTGSVPVNKAMQFNCSACIVAGYNAAAEINSV